jgi:hypothetical protein
VGIGVLQQHAAALTLAEDPGAIVTYDARLRDAELELGSSVFVLV